jgi:hypothetical protein
MRRLFDLHLDLIEQVERELEPQGPGGGSGASTGD